MSCKYFNPELTKNQIIKHSKHQFIEGDVEHWWHEETGRGIRTRFSDDLLWLPYVVADYIEFTGDYSILNVKTKYLKGEVLPDGVDEKYDLYLPSEIEGTIYEHCIKAIEKSLDFGEHGLPKIGSGDWNDGFSTVGNKGKGESVWLAFFLGNVLERFSKLCEYVEKNINNNGENDEMHGIACNEKSNADDSKLIELKSIKYREIAERLRKSINANAWDGRWFNRAFTDDGKVLR